MKHTNFLSVFVLICFFTSCKETASKDQSDFFFYIPKLDIGITTSKRMGAKFYVMFAKDSTQHSSDVDFLEYVTSGDMGNVNLIFDPHHKDTVYIEAVGALKTTNPVYYNLKVLKKSEFYSRFFEVDPDTNYLRLKYPFIYVHMLTSTYDIWIEEYRVNYIKLKEGNMYEGGKGINIQMKRTSTQNMSKLIGEGDKPLCQH